MLTTTNDPPDDPKANLLMTIEKAVFCNIIIPLQRLCDVHMVRPPGGDFSLFLLSLQQVVLKKGPVDSMNERRVDAYEGRLDPD